MSRRAASGLCALTLALVTTTAAPAFGSTYAATDESPGCAAPTVRVSTADELQRAFDGANPGAVITVARGVYKGTFVARGGSVDRPVRVCGEPGAVLDGGDVHSGYVLHLDGAQGWWISGLTIRNGKKGVMVDGGRSVLLDRLTINDIGEEGVHFRKGTSYSTVWGTAISDTGRVAAQYGEGIYVGSAVNHWCDYSHCQRDPCDHNLLAFNTIRNTPAEAVDIKEGTTGGTLMQTVMDGAGLTAADSVLDVKGNGWTIIGNLVTNPPAESFQVHERVKGWGQGTVFADNYLQSG